MEIGSGIIWNVTLSICVPIFVFWLRSLSQRFDRMDADIHSFRAGLSETREKMAHNYVTKTDLQDDIKSIMIRFDRLEEKFDKILTERLSRM
jgi:hypothetical protein|tara:strand:- start:4284 stop:4559 length:276 start_codon:yes stop_codon:yes gene_type:complete